MALNEDKRLKDLEVESKLIADQIRAEKANKPCNDLCNFFVIERKKYKKSNEIEDLLNSHHLRS